MNKMYDVVQAFDATAAISGRIRRFDVGESVVTDFKRTAQLITIESDLGSFL